MVYDPCVGIAGHCGGIDQRKLSILCAVFFQTYCGAEGYTFNKKWFRLPSEHVGDPSIFHVHNYYRWHPCHLLAIQVYVQQRPGI